MSNKLETVRLVLYRRDSIEPEQKQLKNHNKTSIVT